MSAPVTGTDLPVIVFPHGRGGSTSLPSRPRRPQRPRPLDDIEAGVQGLAGRVDRTGIVATGRAQLEKLFLSLA